MFEHVGAESSCSALPREMASVQKLPTANLELDVETDGEMQTLYDELRRMAGAFLAGERISHTLQPTALVHEAWLRLQDLDATGIPDGDERATAIGRAARVMRQVLVDHARRKNADKRGGGLERAPLEDVVEHAVSSNPEGLLDLEEALRQLEEVDPQLCRLAELRLFGGLSAAEAAIVLQVSVPTARSHWEYARARLARTLHGYELA